MNLKFWQRKKSATGMVHVSTLPIRHLTVLDLRPNDIIAVTTNRKLSSHETEIMNRVFRETLELSNKLVFLDESMSVGVIRKS